MVSGRIKRLLDSELVEAFADRRMVVGLFLVLISFVYEYVTIKH